MKEFTERLLLFPAFFFVLHDRHWQREELPGRVAKLEGEWTLRRRTLLFFERTLGPHSEKKKDRKKEKELKPLRQAFQI